MSNFNFQLSNLKLLLSEIQSKYPSGLASLGGIESRHDAVLSQRDSHQATLTYPGFGVRILNNRGTVAFKSSPIATIPEMKSYHMILHQELENRSCSGRVVLIENLEPFLFAERVHDEHDVAIYYGGTIAEDLINWLKNQKVHITVAPDYDPVGMDQFERLRKHLEVALFLPDNIENAFEKYSKRSTLEKSNNRAVLSRLESKTTHSETTNIVLDLIKKNQGGLDQEVFYDTNTKLFL